MNIDSINNGIVIDHITAGKAMKIYESLSLSKLNCPVAMIMNVKSERMGKKDIIKVDAPIDINLDVLGYIDSGITVNIIKNGVLTDKHTLSLPEKIVGIIKCKNPRCITSCEQGLEHEFVLADKENQVYRCAYCESAYNPNK
ncbi:MAG: aspartate carbamoyltransferase regulatory subunit [Oscillospiraceae bacterium]|nr:aspartate carbamoyltransferase regulatory subunit [Oscillospiraceae bacterium]